MPPTRSNEPPEDSNAKARLEWNESEGRTLGALDSFERSLKLAFELHNSGRGPQAEALCRMLMQIRPQDAQLLFLLGMVLHQAGRDEEAVKWLSLASQYQPQSARIFNGLGCACQRLNDHSRAAAAFRRALQLKPESNAADYNLGNTCYKQGRIGEAAALFHSAVRKNPRDPASWNNLGKCLKELNRLEESIQAYDRALELAPDYALARYGRGIALLTAGRLPEGFRDYEARGHVITPRQFAPPRWDGSPAPAQTLFLHAEQGFGDALQMVRFVPAARERVGRVILECREELLSLFQFSKCADAVIPYGAEIPPFDRRLSLISLPGALGTTLDTIPRRIPYLSAPAGKPLPPAEAGRLKVGLAWAGNPGHHQDTVRSIRLEQLAPILQAKGATFYSLRKAVPEEDQACLRASRIHTGLKLPDFLETAALVARMDLIIAVDTAVAHLAGALGKPVWVLLQHSPDWRWLLDRSDSPWYPTMRLFRQTERNRWDLPVQRVAEELSGGRNKTGLTGFTG